MHLGHIVGAVAAAALVFGVCRVTSAAQARETGDDVHIVARADGTAVVEHHLRWRAAHGPLKSIDVSGVDRAAAVERDVIVTSAEGERTFGEAARAEDGAVHVAFDTGREPERGSFDVRLVWSVDLAAEGALVRDGASWVLTLRNPTPSDAFDSARLTLDVPAAAGPPEPIDPATGVVDLSQQVSARREVAGEGARDVLELVRPHVARDEVVTWTVRLDPKAFALAGTVAARAPAAGPQAGARLKLLASVLGFAALAALFGALVRAKTRAVQAACAARGVVPLALLPLPPPARAAVAGGALAAGAALQLRGLYDTGGALVALALLAAAHRAPRPAIAPRGPGRWLVLRPREAFAASVPASDAFDVGTRAGQLAGVVVFAAVASAAAIAGRSSAEAAMVIVLDAMVLVPLGCTGRRSQLRPDLSADAAPQLAAAYRRLSRLDVLRVAPWARVVADGVVDELRLLVAPRASLPGFVGVELGIAWSATPVGWASHPEVLVRVLDSSPASSRLAEIAPEARIVTGRRPEERVARLVPRRANGAGVVELLRTVVEWMADRRSYGRPESLAPEDAMELRRATASSQRRRERRGEVVMLEGVRT
jgi:hypothetical protein